MIHHEHGGSGSAASRGHLVAKAVGAFVKKASIPDSIEEKMALLGALFFATGGLDEGLEVALDWTSTWPENLAADMIERLWAGWREKPGKCDLDFVEDFLRPQGWNFEEYLSEEEQEALQHFALSAISAEPQPTAEPPSVLLRFSLIDELPELQSQARNQQPLCAGVAVKGQASVWYAEPNTGKTALALWLLILDIQGGRLDPGCLFYFNLDDTLQGLIEKTELGRQHGFHVVSEGYREFRAADFPVLVEQLIAANECHGVVIVLDTLKKFTDIMDKRISSGFGKLIRRFVLRGGTCLALAHTNKRRNADGEPIYAGTSDIIEDFDCAYLAYEIGLDQVSETKTILFRNKKSRGNVRREVCFQYSVQDSLSYRDLLASIAEVSDEEIESRSRRRKLESDLELIEIVRESIQGGTNTKMSLAAKLMQEAHCSKRNAIRILEEYEGSDPELQFWQFRVGPRGAKIYHLLKP